MKSFTAVIIFLTFLFFSKSAFPQIYVATNGIDTNPGTIDQPFVSITAAVDKASAGDTIYVRGGVYILSATINISKNGTPDSLFSLIVYQNEKPLLDFSSMAVNSSNRGINLKGNYWHVKGITIKGAGDNGMNLSGSNDIIEFCSFLENRDTGLQLSNGASDNQIINCDSYFNADPGNGNADGFAPKLDVGTNNYFYGCRSWQNSDDGWDGYMRGANDVSTTLENCWCFSNGYLKNGKLSNGNGNGYKMGGSDDKTLMHNMTLKNCLAFYNLVKGFDQNNNKGSMTLYNCTGYRNGTNYSITSALNSGKTAAVINCAALDNIGSVANFVVQKTNSWILPLKATTDDFVSIDTAGVRGTRNSDGSLPYVSFMHLASGSDLINSGTDIGLSYMGGAPDIGAFEFDPLTPVELTSFTAFIDKNSVILQWNTATETNNLGFEIQRSLSPTPSPGEGGNETLYRGAWASIGFSAGSGSSSDKKEYQFKDYNAPRGTIYYRLKQVNYGGSFNLSDEIKVNNNKPSGFELSQNYPNPFNPNTVINFSVSEPGEVSLIVYNLLGEKAAILINKEIKEPGNYSVNFDASGLSDGLYIYTLKQGQTSISRKMMLLK